MRYAPGSITAGFIAVAAVVYAAPAVSAQPAAGASAPVQGTVIGRLHDGSVTVRFARGDALGTVAVRGWTSAALELNGQPASAGSLAVGTTIIAAGRWSGPGDFVASRVRALTPVSAVSGAAGHIRRLDGSLQAVVVRTFDGRDITGYLRQSSFVAPTGARPATFAELRTGELVRLVGNADSAPDGQMMVTAVYPGMPSA